jgi:hypothetical protein
MEFPLAWLPAQHRRQTFIAAAGVTGFLFAVLTLAGRPLSVPGISPGGILSYEFAGTLENARQMLAAWGETGRLHAAFSLGLDYVFMLAYPVFFCLLCERSAARARDGWLRLGVGLAWGQWLAAALDALENAALLSVLFGSPAAVWAPLAWGCAALKFALIFAAVAYWAASRLRRD